MLKKIVVYFTVGALLLTVVGACASVQQIKDLNQPSEEVVTEEEPALTLTAEEVALHNTEADCWMILENNVYNFTDYIDSHPAGDAILEGCGQDRTELFETRPMGSGTPHSDNARDLLEDYLLGPLSTS